LRTFEKGEQGGVCKKCAAALQKGRGDTGSCQKEEKKCVPNLFGGKKEEQKGTRKKNHATGVRVGK